MNPKGSIIKKRGFRKANDIDGMICCYTIHVIFMLFFFLKIETRDYSWETFLSE